MEALEMQIRHVIFQMLDKHWGIGKYFYNMINLLRFMINLWKFCYKYTAENVDDGMFESEKPSVPF